MSDEEFVTVCSSQSLITSSSTGQRHNSSLTDCDCTMVKMRKAEIGLSVARNWLPVQMRVEDLYPGGDCGEEVVARTIGRQRSCMSYMGLCLALFAIRSDLAHACSEMHADTLFASISRIVWRVTCIWL